MNSHNRVFISYSHKDKIYLERLLVHLTPYQRNGDVTVWDDTKIRPGTHWMEEIESELSYATSAILLISADFLASNFITTRELPRLLESAEYKGLQVIPVILKPCLFTETIELSRYQSVNEPNAPIISMNESQREETWTKVAKLIGNRSQLALPQDNAKQELWYTMLAFLANSLHNPMIIGTYYVYEYQYIDVLDFIIDITEFFQFDSRLTFVYDRVRIRLLSCGWDGDGKLGLIWLPPFIDQHIEDGWGLLVWHVKQINNGLNYLLAPQELPFPLLKRCS